MASFPLAGFLSCIPPSLTSRPGVSVIQGRADSRPVPGACVLRGAGCVKIQPSCGTSGHEFENAFPFVFPFGLLYFNCSSSDPNSHSSVQLPSAQLEHSLPCHSGYEIGLSIARDREAADCVPSVTAASQVFAALDLWSRPSRVQAHQPRIDFGR